MRKHKSEKTIFQRFIQLLRIDFRHRFHTLSCRGNTLVQLLEAGRAEASTRPVLRSGGGWVVEHANHVARRKWVHPARGVQIVAVDEGSGWLRST